MKFERIDWILNTNISPPHHLQCIISAIFINGLMGTNSFSLCVRSGGSMRNSLHYIAHIATRHPHRDGRDLFNKYSGQVLSLRTIRRMRALFVRNGLLCSPPHRRNCRTLRGGYVRCTHIRKFTFAVNTATPAML